MKTMLSNMYRLILIVLITSASLAAAGGRNSLEEDVLSAEERAAGTTCFLDASDCSVHSGASSELTVEDLDPLDLSSPDSPDWRKEEERMGVAQLSVVTAKPTKSAGVAARPVEMGLDEELLRSAVRDRNTDKVRQLLDKGTRFGEPDQNGCTVLNYACKHLRSMIKPWPYFFAIMNGYLNTEWYSRSVGRRKYVKAQIERLINVHCSRGRGDMRVVITSLLGGAIDSGKEEIESFCSMVDEILKSPGT